MTQVKTSYALTDQVRSIDKVRVISSLGTIASQQLAAIDLGLRLLMGLS